MQFEVKRLSAEAVASFVAGEYRAGVANLPDRRGVYVYYLADLTEGGVRSTKDTKPPLPLLRVKMPTLDAEVNTLSLLLQQVQVVLSKASSSQPINFVQLTLSSPVLLPDTEHSIMFCNLFATYK